MIPNRIEPGPGQESVWDYPRPPRIEPFEKKILIILDGIALAETVRSFRVLDAPEYR